MLHVKNISGRYWLFIANGCEVLIFEREWDVSNYCLLRFGKLPELVKS